MEGIAQFHRKNPPFKTSEKDKKLTEPSWAECEKKIKDVEKWAAVLEGLLKDVTTATNELHGATAEAFRYAPVVDCAFNESPLALPRQIFAIRAHLKKLGWTAVNHGQVMRSTLEIADLTNVIRDGLKWLVKLKNEKSN